MGIAVGRYRYNHWKEGQEIYKFETISLQKRHVKAVSK